jgi:hypothetical protein
MDERCRKPNGMLLVLLLSLLLVLLISTIRNAPVDCIYTKGEKEIMLLRPIKNNCGLLALLLVDTNTTDSKLVIIGRRGMMIMIMMIHTTQK